MAEADLSRVINLIMENPSLVEQIRNMVEHSEKKDADTEQKEAPTEISREKFSENTYSEGHASRRNDLLRAIRPYLSEERGKAIESMITIADIISATKKGT